MNNTKKITLAAIFVVLTAVGAFIKIPIPYVSITLQIFFVILAGVCLGSKWGAFSQLTYVAAGLLGLPVFTTGGGFGSVLSPTFGYILGFIFGAFVAGYYVQKKGDHTFKTVAIAGTLCVALIYLVGVPYLAAVLKLVVHKEGAVKYALTAGFITTIPGDIIKIAVAALVCSKLPDICFPSLER